MLKANSDQTQPNLKLATHALFQAEVVRHNIGAEQEREIKGFKRS